MPPRRGHRARAARPSRAGDGVARKTTSSQHAGAPAGVGREERQLPQPRLAALLAAWPRVASRSSLAHRAPGPRRPCPGRVQSASVRGDQRAAVRSRLDRVLRSDVAAERVAGGSSAAGRGFRDRPRLARGRRRSLGGRRRVSGLAGEIEQRSGAPAPASRPSPPGPYRHAPPAIAPAAPRLHALPRTCAAAGVAPGARSRAVTTSGARQASALRHAPNAGRPAPSGSRRPQS